MVTETNTLHVISNYFWTVISKHPVQSPNNFDLGFLTHAVPWDFDLGLIIIHHII